ncbi:hypothetical protein B0H13DRAFT_2413497 [Mycena leptocephala]|nr:hypothetical protein B0H13DRAFT_2413497 [Mycena leptocephala]
MATPVASSSVPPQAPAQDAKKSKDTKEKKAKPAAASAFPLELQPPPAFFDHRLKIFEKLKAEHDEFVKDIIVTMPDGSERKAKSWETSPMDVAKRCRRVCPRGLSLPRYLELLDFEHPEGKKVFWHSSAHVLGEAAERHYGCHLCLEDRFVSTRPVSATDYPALEKVAESAIKDKQKFERLVVKKETLLEMFNYNKYKKYLIETKVPDGTSTTVYRCGPMVDLCNSSSYFLGDASNDSLQRIYGISFPDKKQLTEYKAFLVEAAKRDHRRIGKDQELFFFNEMSPGSCFFLPHGTRIYNTLLEFMRVINLSSCNRGAQDCYSRNFKRGYQEVISPNMFHSKLWETSGHWQNYKDDMFTLDVEKEKWALKPMNCPGIALSSELPIRMAEFGIIHRNEASGALTGLTRRYHVFCMPSQVEEEISALFDFMQHQLKQALEKQYPGKWEINPGDGAFYGPKIDISVRDSLRRSFQCATIQLDFQLPERFDLKFRGEDTNNPESRPSERFIAIITEHFAGNGAPFWLSPRQIVVIPVAVPYKDYASQVCERLKSLGLFADVDNGAETLQKKVRNGEIAQYNFILVVGEEEMNTQSVNVRNRDDVGSKVRAEMMPLDDIATKLLALKSSRSLHNKL